ncbi:MAG: hypothetical protein V3R68_03560 [Gammaproteobacteria bacterium]
MKHLRIALSSTFLFFAIVNLNHAIALEIDWDGSIGQGEHKYIPALSNPLFNETPYITTEVRPIFIHQTMESQNTPIGGGLFGGDINLVAAEVRIALTDNLGIIATKDGYAWIDFDTATNAVTDDPEGFANIAFGLKYAFWNNVEDQSILTFGVKYEPPTGGLSIDTALPYPFDNVDLNQSGDGFINPFLSGAKRFGKVGVQGSIGANFAIDDDHDSSMVHYTLHTDYAFTENVYPMLEFNGFTIFDHGTRTPVTFDGVDLVNLGCSADCGTVLTVAGGLRIRATDHILLGAGIEKSIARDDLLDWRSYFDMIIHF